MKTSFAILLPAALLTSAHAQKGNILFDDHFDNSSISSDRNGVNGGFGPKGVNNGIGNNGYVRENDSIGIVATNGKVANQGVGLHSKKPLNLGKLKGFTLTFDVKQLGGQPALNGYFLGLSNRRTSHYLKANHFGIEIQSNANFSEFVVDLVSQKNASEAQILPFGKKRQHFKDGITVSFTVKRDNTYSYVLSGTGKVISGKGKLRHTTYEAEFGNSSYIVLATQRGGHPHGDASLKVDRVTLKALP